MQWEIFKIHLQLYFLNDCHTPALFSLSSCYERFKDGIARSSSFTLSKIPLLLQQIIPLKKQDRFILPFGFWFVVTTILLVMPVSADEEESWITNIPLYDKWIHAFLFMILSVLLCWGIYKIRGGSSKLRTYFIWIGIGCLLYGIAMEFVQKYFVPERSFDGGDIIADGIGAFAGSFISMKRFIKK
jgi:VanZ family protein